VLRQHLEFARSRNKPVSFPEWGQAFHNTGKYIELMHTWFKSLPTTGPGRLLYQSYFNDPSQPGYDLNNYPTTKQAYITTFKTWGLGAPVPAPTTPTTVAPPTTPPTTPTTVAPPTTPPTTPTTVAPPTAPPTTPTTVAPPTTPTTVAPPTTPPTTPTTVAPPTTPPAGTAAPVSAFSPGSETEASLRLTWVDAGLLVDWSHPDAKLYNVRYQRTGSTGWTWLGTVGAAMTSTTFDLDPSNGYTVEVISYVAPAWRTWNRATIQRTSSTTTTPPPPPTGALGPSSVFSPGSETEASLRLTWVDAGLRVDWSHPDAKLYIVRHQRTGSTGWTWLGTVGSSKTSTTLDLDPSKGHTVEVISYVYPAWRTWNRAVIQGQPE
jgi:hypothetical protein